MIYMGREWKRMKLGNLVLFDDFLGIEKIFFTFRWKSDDKISSDIDSMTISTLESPQLREDFPKFDPIIMSIHRLEYWSRARLDREMDIGIYSSILKKLDKFIRHKFDTER